MANSAEPDKETLQKEIVRLREENERLRSMLKLPEDVPAAPIIREQSTLFPSEEPLPVVDTKSTVEQKVALFRALFKGRDDVYAVQWVNEHTGKKGYSPARFGGYGGKFGDKRTLSLTNEVIYQHLSGDKVLGIYPLLKDDTCFFLACDFDDEGWELDAKEYIETCRHWKVPACLERSRSGKGGHAWIFFSGAVSAVAARRLGTGILRETMIVRAEMDLASYDRFFPNQDFMPKGGYGNLIALPLQRKARILGNTEFLGDDFKPWPDQWAFLSRMQRLSPKHLEALLETMPPVSVGLESALVPVKPIRKEPPLPKVIQAELCAELSLVKSGLTPSLLSQLKHVASMNNPEFYKKQKLRFSTFQTPRFIRCYREDLTHIHLPRGLMENVKKIVEKKGSKLGLIDRRPKTRHLKLVFKAELKPAQETAVTALLSGEHGVMVSPPGTGKTVVACAAIARRNVPTLILLHRKPILEQWRAQLISTLGLTKKEIGQLGGGRKRKSGVVDLAMIQSLRNKADIEELLGTYGLIIIDECHHIPAVSFEEVLKHAKSRYILGLTATPYRRDDLPPKKWTQRRVGSSIATGS